MFTNVLIQNGNARRREIERLRGLLMSASRYVESYAENENNHPQARAGAMMLLKDINSTLR